ncbi:MAG: hypothetical protein QF464_14050, partial [Myxococcota bacterium]|nr:hypothetical protein [Myxococcota bacterium]
PVVHLDTSAWAWPFTGGRTDVVAELEGLDISLPGLSGAALESVSLDVREGSLTLRRGALRLRLPGVRDALRGDVARVGGRWSMDLRTPTSLRVGEWFTLALEPGAQGVFDAQGLATLRGDIRVDAPDLDPFTLPALNHDPSHAELHVAATDLRQAGRFITRYPLRVTGAALDTRAMGEAHTIPSLDLRVDAAFATPAASPAEGSIVLSVGHDGLTRDAHYRARPHLAGLMWEAKLRHERGEFVGTMAAVDGARGGLARVTRPQLDVAVSLGGTKGAYQMLSGYGAVRAPRDLGAEDVAFFDTPYVVVGGDLRIGWNRTVPGPDLTGYDERRPGSPLVTGGSLVLADRGGGATLGAQVEMRYAEGRDPVATLQGQWRFFGHRGAGFGQGHARVRKRGQVEGHVGLQLDIDAPHGELIHLAAPVDFVARGKNLTLATARWETLMAEGSLRAEGDLHGRVDAAANTADLTFTTQMATRGDWAWPEDRTVGLFQVDMVSRGTLGVHFTGDEREGTFTVAPADTTWDAVVSGPLDLGFATTLIGGTIASGRGVACFPPTCVRGRMDVSIEHMGFEFDAHPGWFELSSCTGGCAR